MPHVNWRAARGLKPPKTIDIYALVDPDTNEQRYIGKSNDYAKRLHLHVCHARKGNPTPVARWIRALLAQGKRPIIILLERVKYAEWQTAERRWIAKAKESGADLTNVSLGGGGP